MHVYVCVYVCAGATDDHGGYGEDYVYCEYRIKMLACRSLYISQNQACLLSQFFL